MEFAMPSHLTILEQTQHKQILTFILWAVMVTSLVLGIYDIQFKQLDSLLGLFGLAVLCLPLLWLNAKGHTFISAILFCLLILAVIFDSLYIGDGILDSGILAFPIFILLGTLFFGKRAASVFALASIGAMIWIVYLEIAGKIIPTIKPARYTDLIPIGVLFLMAATAIWVIVGNMEKNLEQVKKSEDEIRETYNLTLEAWNKVLENRDKETQGHSQRVVELSIRLARSLGCTEEQIEILHRGALLHDIGKLAIPDGVLLKPSSLDESEMKLVKQHPGYAKEFLAGIPFLQPSLDVPYSHHERWDGQGYPQGLKGEEIPKLARIFTIVDQWDALRTKRVYRPAWTRKKTITYLKENEGKIFDPQITEVFLQII
jgi:hypothetical protein